MGDFGVDKPLLLNETGFGCRETDGFCNPLDEVFFQNQADHLVRSYTRAFSENLMGLIWYTLNNPGFRNSSLLDPSASPRPAYDAYQVLIAQLQYGKYHAPVDYGAGIESYEFKRKLERMHIIWAIHPASTFNVLVPDSELIAAYDRDGTLLDPQLIGANRQIVVGFSPVYIHLHP
jgi:hypothetical protein